MRNTVLLLIVFLAFSCSNSVDVAQIEEALLKIDTEFSDYSAEHGFKAAFADYIADDGVLLRPESHPIIGKEAVIKVMNEDNESEYSATWEPQFAKAAASGELGYTFGIYTIKSDSSVVLLQGTYVTIWTKKDGAWKFVLDTGNEGLGE